MVSGHTPTHHRQHFSGDWDRAYDTAARGCTASLGTAGHLGGRNRNESPSGSSGKGLLRTWARIGLWPVGWPNPGSEVGSQLTPMLFDPLNCSSKSGVLRMGTFFIRAL